MALNGWKFASASQIWINVGTLNIFIGHIWLKGLVSDFYSRMHGDIE